MSVEAILEGRPAAGWFWRAYVAAWLVLAAGALGYLVLVTNHPRYAPKLAALTGVPLHGSGASNPKAADVASATELEKMRSALKQLNARVSEVQDTVEEQRKTVAAFSEKVAAASVPAARPEADGPVSPGDPVGTPNAFPRVRSVRTIEEPPQVTTEEPPPSSAPRRQAPRNSKFPPLPTRVVRSAIPRTTASITPGLQPRILNEDAGSPRSVERPEPSSRPRRQVPSASPAPTPRTATPSLDRSPSTISFGAPSVSYGGARASAVTLSTAASLDGLRVSWDQLTQTHPALLAGLQPRYSREANGTYRLLAGPLDDRVSADRLCNALRTSNVACGVSSYTGNAL